MAQFSGNQQQLIHRISGLEGHVRSLRKLITEEREPLEVLMQISSIRAGIERLSHVIFEEFVEGALHDIQTDEARTAAIADISARRSRPFADRYGEHRTRLSVQGQHDHNRWASPNGGRSGKSSGGPRRGAPAGGAGTLAHGALSGARRDAAGEERADLRRDDRVRAIVGGVHLAATAQRTPAESDSEPQ